MWGIFSKILIFIMLTSLVPQQCASIDTNIFFKYYRLCITTRWIKITLDAIEHANVRQYLNDELYSFIAGKNTWKCNMLYYHVKPIKHCDGFTQIYEFLLKKNCHIYKLNKDTNLCQHVIHDLSCLYAWNNYIYSLEFCLFVTCQW